MYKSNNSYFLFVAALIVITLSITTIASDPVGYNDQSRQSKVNLKELKATPQWQDMVTSYQVLTNCLANYDGRIVATTNAIAQVPDADTKTAINKLYKMLTDLREAMDAQASLDVDYKLIIKSVVTNGISGN